ncbi:unnamed protein product [Microthlaspi erraticum]|uniref:DC1 domain-containing protein n=1 Tax=Microthlaspi erraticum TaxID=1685480 RepID=A0A6D2L8V7_9BRAS|nr:unnamed protein product [Microthlaspi erraticum]
MTTIEGPETHNHCLSLIPKMIRFTCHLCGLFDDRFPYVCNLCDLSFHKDCAESTRELNYSCHPKHPLKRGKCCLCGNTLPIVFYHCSICNFSVDLNCSKHPPPFTLVHPKAHVHQLILMPQRSFVCNACGMDDDPNPYVCPECNFMIHRNCIDVPRVIKINRHVHRIHYNHCLGAGDWSCGQSRPWEQAEQAPACGPLSLYRIIRPIFPKISRSLVVSLLSPELQGHEFETPRQTNQPFFKNSLRPFISQGRPWLWSVP